MTRRLWRILGSLVALGTCGQGLVAGNAAFRIIATEGVRHYTYTSSEKTPGQPEKRYRVDFDLATGSDGSVTAVLLKAESAVGDTWSTPAVDAACRRALHGDGHALARITLAPLSPEATKLGEEFMTMCAPAAYFFPLTDILNVSLVQTSPKFRLADLKTTGARARFEGFDTKLERLGIAIAASSPGGEILLHDMNPGVLTIDWTPDPMQIEIINRKTDTRPEVNLKGVERYAFRLEIDPASGALERAATTEDNLDLAVSMPDIPPDKMPRIAISREVAIETARNDR